MMGRMADTVTGWLCLCLRRAHFTHAPSAWEEGDCFLVLRQYVCLPLAPELKGHPQPLFSQTLTRLLRITTVSAVACFWQAFTNKWWHMFIARFVLGLGIGPKSATTRQCL